MVTIISDFRDTNLDTVNTISRKLRKQLGTGGTCYEKTIELQGDCRIPAAHWLKQQGFKLKGEVM